MHISFSMKAVQTVCLSTLIIALLVCTQILSTSAIPKLFQDVADSERTGVVDPKENKKAGLGVGLADYEPPGPNPGHDPISPPPPGIRYGY
ncbi:hypothetical protein CDL12_19350 [Handroanthus impetiginosus]|uniref:Transmembrane protein n=1 Tax=Handroanthus impetiginosus TaxID=429701 RepID=A0A2G9GS31_9LAMI|nr:hypothetical protein CDL12_19350 [Handroanthus impetiginosus]